MIKINYHHHLNNSGFGNKLFLNFFARALSIETQQPLFNWMHTKIYPIEKDYCKGVQGIEKDNWNLIWPYVSNDGEDMTIIGKNNNIGQLYGNEYHQNCKVIKLVSKYKDCLIKNFGDEDGLFIHVRLGDLAKDRRWLHTCNYEYYERCLSNIDCDKRYLASDSPHHPLVNKLMSKFDLQPCKKTPEETIIFGSRFRNKILSLGTFSWWIGFVGSQYNVMCPNPSERGGWHGRIFECMQNWNMVSNSHEKNN